MHAVGKVCVILSLLFVGLASGCPTWFTNTTGQCECGVDFTNKIICHDDEGRVDVQTGICMTYDYSTDSVLAGYCPYGYSSNMTNRVYSSLPGDPTQLNEATCGPYKREGLLCGQCIKGFGPAVYSYDLRCANCTDISTGYAIILYLLLEFLPITAFFFVIVIFHFNITSGPMLGYVMFCQGWTFAVQCNMYILDSIQSQLPLPLVIFARISMVLADIWNLHFFKFVLPSFCLSDRLTGIHVHLLSLFAAVYPVLLMATAYIAIQLHARDYRVVHLFWKPFGICFATFKGNWSASDSVTHAFATFTMLSSYTLIFQSFALVVHSPVYNANGTVSSTVLLYDPSIVLYSPEHIPYLVVAVVLLFFLAVCPALLLCLYPTRIYERLSRCCSPRKRIAVSIFAEALHSCFKDGLNGTRDCRAFAGLCIMTPLLYSMIYIAVERMIQVSVPRPLAIGFFFLFLALFVSYVRPCKSLIMNLSLSFHSMLFGILSVNFELWMEDFSFSTETLAVTFAVVSTMPHFVILVWVGYKITSCVSSRYGCRLKTALAVLRRAALPLRRRHDYEELRGSLETN